MAILQTVVDDELADQIAKTAEKEKRSMSNMVAILIQFAMTSYPKVTNQKDKK